LCLMVCNYYMKKQQPASHLLACCALKHCVAACGCARAWWLDWVAGMAGVHGCNIRT
jgi:hypothetical protein